MEIAALEQLVQMVRESSAGELTLRQGGARVTIRKSAKSTAASLVEQDSEEYSYTTQYADVMDDEFDGETGAPERTVMITAPLVGVFAHVKPLIGLNAHVSEGQSVGVIEAMKLLTEIKAPTSGTIVDIFIEASHPVEYGQALFEIRPD